ncbi:site-specific integrase, partial [Bacillus subtilis KCTC 1028 = ATCC 6051a]
AEKEINPSPVTKLPIYYLQLQITLELKNRYQHHSMRKTWGYWAYKKGYSLALIMEALNHSSIAITKKYLGITQEDLDDVYMSMNL